MPGVAGLLRQAGAVPDHALDEAVGQAQPIGAPAPPPTHVAPAQARGEAKPAQQQCDMQSAPCPQADDRGGENQFNERHEADKAAAERQVFDPVGLQHEAKKLADALLAPVV